MFKIIILLALAIASAAAQEAPSSEAAPEPYSYGYQTDTHAASEQRDPQGRVTGFYTIADADGRERRVEYTADESGFRAKVATNEVGTKSESPADVEIQASEPTPGQLVYQSQPPQVQYQQAAPAFRQQTVTQQSSVAAVQRPFRSQTQYFQQQAPTVSYGYNPAGYGYGNYAYGNGAYGAGYGTGYGSGYGYRSGYYGATGYGVPNVGNYNNHLPSQYYRSITTTSSGGPSTYTVGGQNVRYVSQPGVTTTGVRTVNYPAGVSYSGGSYGSSYGVPAGVTTTRSSSSSQGSSNYLVLQKRAAEEKSN